MSDRKWCASASENARTLTHTRGMSGSCDGRVMARPPGASVDKQQFTSPAAPPNNLQRIPTPPLALLRPPARWPRYDRPQTRHAGAIGSYSQLRMALLNPPCSHKRSHTNTREQGLVSARRGNEKRTFRGTRAGSGPCAPSGNPASRARTHTSCTTQCTVVTGARGGGARHLLLLEVVVRDQRQDHHHEHHGHRRRLVECPCLVLVLTKHLNTLRGAKGARGKGGHTCAPTQRHARPHPPALPPPRCSSSSRQAQETCPPCRASALRMRSGARPAASC